jgi:iron uptake system component EfeO
MTGDGIATAITVTSDNESAVDPRIDAAVAGYLTYAEAQAQSSLDLTKQLAAAIAAGNVEEAKRLYPASRVGWESIEPVAESFGDLDPRIDLREADLEAGQEWTGWHVIEKGLWVDGSTAGLTPVADVLVADLEELLSRVRRVEITGTSMGNGAKELLDEVATGKVTGEEEAFSHTDLVDFDANVAGARKVYELLRPVVAEQDAALATELDTQFDAVQAALQPYRTGAGPADYVSYDTVGPDQRASLAQAVDALAEPLSNVAATVAG